MLRKLCRLEKQCGRRASAVTRSPHTTGAHLAPIRIGKQRNLVKCTTNSGLGVRRGLETTYGAKMLSRRNLLAV
jgi:hypothetical protein